jgi:hypothetical protein
MRVVLSFFIALAAVVPFANSAENKAPVDRFEKPVRLKAGDEFISVESPGYACPTMADVDGDGKDDLIVGQFSRGNMQFFKNVATVGESPEFAAAQWLKSGDDRLEVPGVW